MVPGMAMWMGQWSTDSRTASVDVCPLIALRRLMAVTNPQPDVTERRISQDNADGKM